MQKLISINDTDKAVAEFLKANNIHYSVKFVGSVNSGEWQHDKFYTALFQSARSVCF
jgi:hypothetical protein